MTRDVAGFLRKQAEAGGDLEDLWREAVDLHGKRLWHQMTGVLMQLVVRIDQSSELLRLLYSEAVAEFETKLNPLSLVRICTPIASSYTDKAQAIQFLEKIGQKVRKANEAFALARVLVGFIRLHHLNDLEKAKEVADEVESILDEVDGVGFVHGQYYSLLSEVHKQEGDHAAYYRSSLRLLGCTPLESLEGKGESLEDRAFHLALAALLGKDIFNFGELLAHAILELLRGTPKEWIVHLLSHFNSGNVAEYNRLAAQWKTQPDLQANEAVLFEKICLLALMEMTFRRSATDRLLTFGEVAQQTGLPEDSVELLVMKALAKGLVKGSIDQVASTVNLTWVQPRVLDKNQVKTLMDKVSGLNSAINYMDNMIEQNASEILTV